MLQLFCYIDGAPFWQSIGVEIEDHRSVDSLKDAIWAKQKQRFGLYDASSLDLWRVAIPMPSNSEQVSCVVAGLQEGDMLLPTTKLKHIFKNVPEDTVHVFVKRRSQGDSTDFVARSFKFTRTYGGRVVSQSMTLDATVTIQMLKDCLRNALGPLQRIEIKGVDKQITKDEDLRHVIRMYLDRKDFIITLEDAPMAFSLFRRGHVDELVGSIGLWQPAPPATINASDLKKLYNKIRKGPKNLASEHDVSGLISEIISNALERFPRLEKRSQMPITGSRSHGIVDFAIVPKSMHGIAVGVIEAKLDDQRLGIAQNIMQLEAVDIARRRYHNAKSRVRSPGKTSNGHHNMSLRNRAKEPLDLDRQRKVKEPLAADLKRNAEPHVLYGIVATRAGWWLLRVQVQVGDSEVPRTTAAQFKIPGAISLDLEGWEKDVKRTLEYVIMIFQLMEGVQRS